MKLFICGHARHGKDTFAEFLTAALPGMSFASSSLFVGEKAVFPALKDKYGYRSVRECYLDRAAHRAEWKELISEYNREDKARLARELFKDYDIYVGIRCREELTAARCLADLVFWVDRSYILPPESGRSNSVTRDDADVIIDNNGTLRQLEQKAIRIADFMTKLPPLARVDPQTHPEQFRTLSKGEQVVLGDYEDVSPDGYNGEPVWERVRPVDFGTLAPDPTHPAHRRFCRRKPIQS